MCMWHVHGLMGPVHVDCCSAIAKVPSSGSLPHAASATARFRTGTMNLHCIQ